MKKESEQKRKLSFKEIVKAKDNWERYQEVYAEQVTADQLGEVEKMLGSGELRKGYSTYICLDCGEQLKVPFSCKSRVCSSCGKVHADQWSEALVGRLFNVVHRHVTFTVASELWVYFEQHPESRSLLYEAANATLRQVMRGEPGIVMVLHPYGKDLKVTYHLHVLVSEGGLDKEGMWQEQSYLSYAGLRKIWQYELLSRLREKEGPATETGRLVKYAPCKAKKVREKMSAIGKAVGRIIYRLGWRKRIVRDFKRDPLRCPRCGQAWNYSV